MKRLEQKPRIGPWLTLTFVWSWAFFIAAVYSSHRTGTEGTARMLLIIAGAFGPSLAAFFLSARRGGSRGVTGLLRSGFRFRMPLRILILASVVPLATAGAGQLAAGSWVYSLELTLPLAFIGLFFLGGSFGEEFGWRGVLLPAWLMGNTPISAALAVAAVWAIWHLPLFWIPGTSQFTSPMWLYAIYITALTVQYTWIYIRSQGNLFACMLLHTFTNLTVVVFPLPEPAHQASRFATETVLNAAIAVILITLDRKTFMTKTNTELSPRYD
ncbi:MAG TPA: type II CAAX endopeptidase family protein [Pyrinomonadaceae bacterium]|nr:type II CAAX endopeptidase family protein [Pyrinomonadaceae bacterium]